MTCVIYPHKLLKPIKLLQYNYYKGISPVFNRLVPDKLDELNPSKYRLFRHIKINPINNKITLTDQNTFELLEDSDILNPFFEGLLNLVLDYKVMYNTEKIKQIGCNVHFLRQVAHPGLSVNNVPDGRHQDGADFILSAFVVNLTNVIGGVSSVGTKGGFNYFEKRLLPGEGLIHDDRDYYHDITKIKSLDNKNAGIRDLISFEFLLEKS
jgi:hypothetical protein